MELPVINISGKETGRKVSLSEEIFNLETPNDHAIYLDVRLIQANQRQGTHKAKERGEVRGSTKKPIRQKGSGGARAGHKRSPLWRHGGRVFGPRPRDYSFRLNKKVKTLARASALTYKARENKIIVLEAFNLDKPRTKDFLNILKNLNALNKKVLILTNGVNKNVYLSGRNIPGTRITPVSDINTLDILNADHVLIIEEAVSSIEKIAG
jgi:large subunit ribosomal protein L4